MNKIKILHIIESLGMGGAELRLLEDVRSLTDFNHAVCYLFKNKNQREEGFRKAGAEVYCLGMCCNLDLLLVFFRLLRIIRRYRPQIIHTHLFFANIIARLSNIFYHSIHYVQTIHFPDYIMDGSIKYSKCRHFLEIFTLFLKRPSFIAVSEYVKKESIKALKLDGTEIDVIYNYLNDDWFIPLDGQCLSGAKRIISIGRLHKQKGFEYLIKAMRIILDAQKDAILLIAGDGPEREYLSALINSLGLDKKVFLLGVKSDIKKLIIESDIFVFPSLNEGLGIALIEAMSQEKICIASNIGPLPEIIEDGFDGFLVPPRNEALLAEKIIYAIDNYNCCKEIAIRARLKARTNFSREGSTKLMRRYYCSIINSN